MSYEETYAKRKLYWGERPSWLAKRLAEYLDMPKKVVDLGSGEGRDSIYLAGKGHNVTAVDISEEGLAKLKRLSREKNIMVETVKADVSNTLGLEIVGNFDAILLNNLLQHLRLGVVDSIFEWIKRNLNENGVIAINTFRETEYINDKKIVFADIYGFLKDDGLQKKLNWLERLYEHQGWCKVETHGEDPHRHYCYAIIGRRSDI